MQFCRQVVKRLLKYLPILCLGLMIVPVEPPPDLIPAPKIDQLTVSTETIYPMQKVTVTANVGNQNPASLKFSWFSTSGTFDNPQGHEVTWTAPTSPGMATLFVNVTNSRGESAAASIQLQVRDLLTLRRNTYVKFNVLQRRVSEMDAEANVPLEVAEPIVVDGYEVIPKGYYGVARYVPDSRGRGPGVLVTRVQLADGTIASLWSQSHRLMANGDLPSTLGAYVTEEVKFELDSKGIKPSPDAKEPPVEAYPCIGATFREATIDLGDMGSLFGSFLKASGASDSLPKWVEVAEVKPGSSAASAGLKPGDTIERIGVAGEEIKIESIEDLEAAFKKVRPGETIVVRTDTMRIRIKAETCYRVSEK